MSALIRLSRSSKVLVLAVWLTSILSPSFLGGQSGSSSNIMAPRTSCISAVRSLSERRRDAILKKGLDRRIVSTLAGAVAQLSGRGDMTGQYGEYLDAVLTWVSTLQTEVKKLSDLQKFLVMHQRRYIELERIKQTPGFDYSKIVYFSHTGNIDRPNRSACPTTPYTRPYFKFGSKSELIKQQNKTLKELVMVRDEYGAEIITQVGMHRWMLRKLFQEAGLEEQAAARGRVEQLKAANPQLTVDELISKTREAKTAEQLLDVLYLSLEDSSSWIADEKGRPDQVFTKELDGAFDRLLNPFFEKIHDHPGRFVDKASGVVKQGYQGVTWLNRTWGIVKSVLGVGAIYTALLTLGSDAVTSTVDLYTDYTTPDAVIEYQKLREREQKRKMEISDRTIRALAEADNIEDAQKSFAEVFANYVRENAGDRAALLATEYMEHFIRTGRNDWKPTDEADLNSMAQIAELVALFNVQLFNEGPYPGPDGKPQRFLSSAVMDRWPWRTETKNNLEIIMKAVDSGHLKSAIPLPEGVMPPSYRAAPEPDRRWRIVIAGDKIWNRHLSKGIDFVWDVEPVRWGVLTGIGVGGVVLVKRRIRMRDQYKLEPVREE